MQSCSHVQAQRAHRLDDGERAAPACLRASERSEEAVASGVDLMAAEALQLPPDLGVMTTLQGLPPPIPELGRDFARADDVGEQQGGQPALLLATPHHGWSVRSAGAALNLDGSRNG
jgi:hypothetical protein